MSDNGPIKTCFYLLLIGSIGLFVVLLLVSGIDSIVANPLYQDQYQTNSVLNSLGNFLCSLKLYTPQAVEALGISGYLLLSAMVSMLIVFPIWVLKAYIKDY